MKTRFFCKSTSILLALIFSSNCAALFAQNNCFGEIALQPDGAKGKDAHVSNWHPNQPGASSAEWITTAAWTIDGAPVLWHTYLDFDWSSIPAGAQVLSATLNLYGINTGTDEAISTHSCLSGDNNSIVRRVTGNWDETTMTWNTQPSTTALHQIAVPALCTPEQDVSIDVKTLVQDMIDNPATSFGFQISLATEQYYRNLIFGSSDHTNPAKRPKLVVQYAFPCPCTAEIALQPDGAKGKDAHVSNWHPNQPGASTAEWITTAAWTIDGTPVLWHTYLDFDWSSIPAGAQVLSATLNLYGINTGTDEAISTHSCLSGDNNSIVRRVTGNWDETTMTWNTQPSTTALHQIAVPALCTPEQDVSIDVKTLVQDMIDNPATNFGFQISLATEQYYRNLIFGSSDHTNPAKRPKLVVQYAFPCPCTAELALQPDGAKGKDAHVSDWHPNQPGASTAEWITTAAWTIDGTPVLWHTYLDFDWSSIPAGAQVLSATLNLYGINTGTDEAISTHSCLSGDNNSIVRRVTGNWDETSMTWNTQPSTTALHQIAVPALCTPEQDVSIDVKTLVQDMIDNPATSFGFQISLATEQYYRNLIFGSSDHTNPAKRPKIVVQYAYACDPSVHTTEQSNFADAVRLFPNPTSGMITVQLEQPMEQTLLLQVYNLQGKLLHQEQLPGDAASRAIDLSQFPAGLYLVCIKTRNGATWRSKVVKQ